VFTHALTRVVTVVLLSPRLVTPTRCTRHNTTLWGVYLLPTTCTLTTISSFLWTVRMYVSVVCATFASCCASLYN